MHCKVRTGNLKIGMHVSSLDRPWLDTPFMFQGFTISNEKELEALGKYCDYVYVDPQKGLEPEVCLGQDLALPTNDRLEKFLITHKKQVDYVDEKSFKEEINNARSALDNAYHVIGDIMEDVKTGRALNFKAVRNLVEPVINSIVRNADAYMWLMTLRNKDDYSYSHSVDNCSLAIAFGRHMGLPKEDLSVLGAGTLLLDIGKSSLPDGLLNKASTLTEEEFREIKRHVDYGVKILRESKGFKTDVINIVLTHHERFDGSGYPNALKGHSIPVYGRMAGIIDSYDAMTSKRVYREAISQYNALQSIYNWRRTLFQEELVEQFLQCLGVYPTGTIVEMTTGEVAIVLAQNRTRRLKPKIMMLLDPDKNPYHMFRIIDLNSLADSGEASALRILKAHEPGAFGIDPTEFYL